MSTVEDTATEPLGRWGRTWRILGSVLFSAFVLTATLADLDKLGIADETRFMVPITVDVLVVAPLLAVALWWHRRFPTWLSVAFILLGGVSTMATGPGLLLLVSVATRRSWPGIASAVGATLLAGLVYETVYPSSVRPPWWLAGPLYCAVTAGIVAWGMYLGTRRELIAQWRWRAENAHAEQARQVLAAQRDEQQRIAREMHDVLAHRLAQVALHAGALSFRTDLPPETVRAEAEVIRSSAATALDDLRAILGVLRDDSLAGAESPQPTLADLSTLVAEAPGHTRPNLHVDIDGDVPVALGRHVYRMTQEALTNAARHAPGAHVDITVAGRPGHGLRLLVTNGPGSGPPHSGGAGLGLVSLRERAHLSGGTVEAGPQKDGGWTIDAQLPWPV